MPINYYPSFGVVGTYTPDNLVTGATRTKSVTIKAGQNLVRGTVLQEGTAGDVGKYLICTVDASARFILAEDCNAVSDRSAMVFVNGEFNPESLTLGGGATLAGVEKTLEPLSIFFSKMVK